MVKNNHFPSLLIDQLSHTTCNKENKHIEICRTILCINICHLFHEGIKKARIYLNLKIKFQHYSIFYVVFDIANCRVMHILTGAVISSAVPL